MTTRLSLIALLLLTLFSFPAAAQESPAAGELAVELRGLSKSVDRLAALLDAQSRERQEDVSYRKLELAIAYLNFRSRRIESLERDIDSSKAQRSRLEDNLPVFAERIREIEADMQEYPQGAPQELKEALKGIQMQYDLFKERIARIDDQLILKDNLLYELQTQIRDVEAYVQKHLDM